MLITVGEARRSTAALLFFSRSKHDFIVPLGVIYHEKHRGGVHLVLGGDLGAVGGPRVPVQGHQTMQIIRYFTKSVHMINTPFFGAAKHHRGHDVVPGHGEQLLGHIHHPFY